MSTSSARQVLPSKALLDVRSTPGKKHFEIGSLDLELGGHIPNVTVAYETFGTFTGDNAVLIAHALTGDSHVASSGDHEKPSNGWWGDIVGPGSYLDTDKWFVVCANVLGGCQGTTGPGSVHPDGNYWGSRWPRITIRDQVATEIALSDALGIDQWASIMGGSMGGMRVLEWLLTAPERTRSSLLLSTTAVASADQIGTQSAQIAAITLDPNWRDGDYYDAGDGHGPETGLGVARQIAHLTYRTELELNTRFGNNHQDGEDAYDYYVVGRHASAGRFAIQSYLHHQGRKLAKRFDAGTYVALTDAMNTHNVARGRGALSEILRRVRVPVIVGGISSDRLYPIYQQQQLADFIPGSGPLREIISPYGHDGFLIETEQIGNLVLETLDLSSK
jgi:homoserine O-acetyltransferase